MAVQLDVLRLAVVGCTCRGLAQARGFTPLHIACLFDRVEVASVLLRRGALVDAVSVSAGHSCPTAMPTSSGWLAPCWFLYSKVDMKPPLWGIALHIVFTHSVVAPASRALSPSLTLRHSAAIDYGCGDGGRAVE